MYAEIVPNIPQISGTYHYEIPEDWPPDKLQAGHLVRIPWVKQRIQGIVVALDDDPPPDIPEFKPVEGLVDPEPVLTHPQLDLAYWLARTYHAPLNKCLMLMLPPGLSKRGDTFYQVLQHKAKANTDAQTWVLATLEKHGPMRGRQLDRHLKRQAPNWRNAIAQLVRRGVLSATPVLDPPSVKPKLLEHVRLILPAAQLPAARAMLDTRRARERLLHYLLTLWPAQPVADDTLAFLPKTGEKQIKQLVKAGWLQLTDDRRLVLARSLAEVAAEIQQAPKKTNRRLQLLDFLAQHGGALLELSWVYAETGASRKHINDLAGRGWIELGEHEVIRDPLRDVDYMPDHPPKLVPDQQAVWQPIQDAFERPVPTSAPRPFLIHGVTGAGKTEIYMRAVEAALQQGQQAIVLVPEIALTPQTVQRFLARFPGKVAVWHSELTDGERYDNWRRARAGQVDIVVGVRSALFAPLPRLGVIVLDEEHDESYKQSLDDDFDARPYYHARETAVEYARRLGAICILGSATPDIVTYNRAQRGHYQLLELPRRIMGHGRRVTAQATRLQTDTRYTALDDSNPEALYLPMPHVHLVDMRQELRAGNRSMFSRALQEGINRALARNEQVILFLNRRGTATYVFCRDCGYTVECSRCGTAMTYHQAGQILICHHCNHRRQSPRSCPKCGSERIRYFGVGTQRVEAAVQETFPQARTLRWDWDTTRQRNAHAAILSQFAGRQANVLIGTQMVAKGLDLPLVTLVGVVSADIGLALPDFRATERTFQLLAQVAGRAGRGLRGGQVILQTYLPDNYAIEAAAEHDYAAFYVHEMRFRREQSYPPYMRLVRLILAGENARWVEDETLRMAEQAKRVIWEQQANSTALIGPVPCFFSRVRGRFRWQVVLRGPAPASLLEHLSFGPGWQVEVDPLNLL